MADSDGSPGARKGAGKSEEAPDEYAPTLDLQIGDIRAMKTALPKDMSVFDAIFDVQTLTW